MLGSGHFVPLSLSAIWLAESPSRSAPPPMTDLDFSDDDDLANRSWWLVAGKYINRIVASLVGSHGLLSHFPILIFGVAGVGAVMHRHWPAWTKVLASCSAIGALMVIGLYCFSQADWREAMFATKWFILFVPLLFFWIGAWLRQARSPVTYGIVAALLFFSGAVSLIGATDPCPRQGFDRYTAAGAMQLVDESHPDQIGAPLAKAK